MSETSSDDKTGYYHFDSEGNLLENVEIVNNENANNQDIIRIKTTPRSQAHCQVAIATALTQTCQRA